MAHEISRREFLKGSLAGAACLGLGGLSIPALAGSQRKPNFVIIFCDDLGYQDVGCFGSPLIKTPNIDRMAAEGMRFTDFHSAAPVCTPSRAALMTGCYPQRVNLPQVINYSHTIGISSKEITMAELLRGQGYATACIGKWHLGWQKEFLPTRHGFDYYYGLPYSNDMKYEDDRLAPLIRGEEILEHPAVQETLTQRYTDEAIQFMTKHRDEPFLVYLPHTFPHKPLHVSKEFAGKSARGLYGDVVECIDWSTGRIMDAIKELGLDDNTVVVFTSDNGPWLIMKEEGGSALPLRKGKGTTWEGGMREPTIMRWPGHIPAGTECSELATMMDLYPTFAGLSGAKLPTDRVIDGKDIRPLMEGKPGAVSPYEVFYYYRADELQAVRSGKWKLVLPHTDQPDKESIPLSLYNLDADISEATNVIDKYPSIVAHLQKYVEQAREDLGDKTTNVVGKGRRPCGQLAPAK